MVNIILYNYKVIQNEHDGVVSIGAIPQQAVDKAAEAAGMKYAVLDEKSFVWEALGRGSNPSPLETPGAQARKEQDHGHREGTEEDTREEQGREG